MEGEKHFTGHVQHSDVPPALSVRAAVAQRTRGVSDETADAMHATITGLMRENESLRASNAELRDALEQIARGDNDRAPQMSAIARDALARSAP